MRPDRALLLKLLWAVYGLMWLGGVMRWRDPGWAAPLFLFLGGVIAVVSAGRRGKALLLVGAIGFAFEWVGVHTGFPFGRYEYTGMLRPLLFGVPPAIACAWIVMFAFVRQFGIRNIWISAGLLAATDLLIDPVASRVLGFWRWLTPGPYFGVPLVNFAGWYLVGIVLFVMDPRQSEGSASGNSAHRILGFSILVFFIARGL
jgi:putative membrane protein